MCSSDLLHPGLKEETAMVVSVNTNAGQMLALQALNRTTKDLATAQLRVTTGLKVNGPADSPAVFAIAQNLRGEIAPEQNLR